MPQKRTTHSIPSLILNASEQVELTPPRWLPEVALMTEVWKRTGLLTRFQEEVHVQRGRMGTYVDCDFALVDLAYTTGHEPSWRSFYKSLGDSNSALAASWGRIASPLRSATSRFHDDIDEASLEALRLILFEDLLERGIPPQSFGGVTSRCGNQFLMFDIDGTKKAARQRDLVSSPDYPEARRRARRLCKPGHTGRKRGEVVRTRTTVQQSHTQEWLGTFSGEGNGQPIQELRRACEASRSYLNHHQLPVESGIVRIDGFYGWASTIAEVRESGLHYIGRCSDYGLLKLLQIPEKVVDMEACELHLPDSGLTFQLYDFDWMEWSAANGSCKPFLTHLLVSRRPAPKGPRKQKVGKRVGSYVYELFITSLKSHDFIASDVVTLYYGRSGFETTYMHEDKEQQPDRTYSYNPAGQEWCQLFSQWVWNERLRQGFAAKGEHTRCTIWSEALPVPEALLPPDSAASNPVQQTEFIEESTPESCAAQEREEELQHLESISEQQPQENIEELQRPESSAEQQPQEVSSEEMQEPESNVAQQTPVAEPAQELTSEHFGAAYFTLLDTKSLMCRAGKILRKEEELIGAEGQKQYRYAAKASDCSRCEWFFLCRPKAKSMRKGRRVTLTVVDEEPQIPQVPKPGGVTKESGQETSQKEPAKPRASLSPVPTQPVGTKPVLWYDLPASMLRRFLTTLLLSVRFDLVVGLLPELASDTTTERLTRAQRAHRRFNYAQRLARNALPQTAVPGSIHIHGLPSKISEYLASLGQNTHAP